MCQLHPELCPLFQETRRQFDEAERRIKLIEREGLSDGIDIPSLNELRYVGFHLLRAFSTNSYEKQKEQLDKAKRHCERASYDAMELGIIQRLEEIRIFQKDYRKITISSVVSDYLEMMEKTQEANAFIAESDPENREAYYSECETHYLTLKKIAEKLMVAREELNKEKNKFTFSTRTVYIGLFLALVGAVAAIAAL